jgi:hypothetical protein
MNCHEAREEFSDIIAGRTGLTESARVDAHVSQCAECRDLLEGLYRLRRRDDNPEQGNASEVYVDPSPDPGDADDLVVEPPQARPWLRPVLIGAALIIVGIGVVFASSVSTWTPERLAALLTGVPRATAPDAQAPAPTAATTPDAATASGASTPREETVNSQEVARAPSPSSSTPHSATEADSALERTKQARVTASKPVPALGLATPPRKPSAAAKSEAPSEGSSASGFRRGEVGQPSAQERGEADRPEGTKKHVGVVVTASPTHLAIDEMGPWRGPDTRPMRYIFQLTGTTKVARTERTQEGRDGWAWGFSEEQLRRTDLRPGDFVTVTARRSGDNEVAISVLAVRPNSRLEIPGSS